MEPNSSRRRRSRTSPRRRLAVSLEAEAKGWPPTSLRVFAHHLCDDGPHPGVRVTLPAPRVTLEWTCKGVRLTFTRYCQWARVTLIHGRVGSLEDCGRRVLPVRPNSQRTRELASPYRILGVCG